MVLVGDVKMSSDPLAESVERVGEAAGVNATAKLG